MQPLLSVSKQAFNELNGWFHLKMKIEYQHFAFMPWMQFAAPRGLMRN